MQSFSFLEGVHSRFSDMVTRPAARPSVHDLRNELGFSFRSRPSSPQVKSGSFRLVRAMAERVGFECIIESNFRNLAGSLGTHVSLARGHQLHRFREKRKIRRGGPRTLVLSRYHSACTGRILRDDNECLLVGAEEEVVSSIRYQCLLTDVRGDGAAQSWSRSSLGV
jgi:hypothetical protein